PTSNSPPATANCPDGGEHDDRADHGNDDALDIDAGWVFQLQEGAREPPTDDCPDDAQEDRADHSFAAAHDHVGEEAGDRAEHDPREDAHPVRPSLRCVSCANVLGVHAIIGVPSPWITPGASGLWAWGLHYGTRMAVVAQRQRAGVQEAGRI